MECFNFLSEDFTKNSLSGTHLKLDVSEFQKIAQKHEANPKCEWKETSFMKEWHYQCLPTLAALFGKIVKAMLMLS